MLELECLVCTASGIIGNLFLLAEFLYYALENYEPNLNYCSGDGNLDDKFFILWAELII